MFAGSFLFDWTSAAHIRSFISIVWVQDEVSVSSLIPLPAIHSFI